MQFAKLAVELIGVPRSMRDDCISVAALAVCKALASDKKRKAETGKGYLYLRIRSRVLTYCMNERKKNSDGVLDWAKNERLQPTGVAVNQSKEQIEAVELLNERGHRLDDVERVLLHKKFWQGSSISTIAEQTGIARSTVHLHIKNALRKLRYSGVR
jgi:RNA polymerase sigma factor (sigma-70 family)